MSARRGFALAAVLAAVVIMAMVVAIGMQRALLAARQGSMDVAHVDIEAAVAGALAALQEAPVDTMRLGTSLPGEPLASGAVVAGSARARWTLVAAAGSFASVEIVADAPLQRGSARGRRVALVAPRRDAAGVLRWVPAGGSGWVQLPAS